MKLTHGSYYRTEEGKVVRVQLEQGGQLVAYDATGTKIRTCGVEDHVNGWEPCGEAAYKAERVKVKAQRTPPTKKKRVRKEKTKEE